MLRNDYRYVLELFAGEESPLGQVAVTVDWDPAREWTEFLGIRKGRLPSPAVGSQSSVVPIWSPELGQPYLSGFRVSVQANGSGQVEADFTTAYFKSLAVRAAARFVESGELKEGDTIHYLGAAFAAPEQKQGASSIRFSAEEIAPALHIREGPLGLMMRGTASHGQILADDFPVLVPRQVLDEAATLSRDAGAKETGGILIGRLRRDSSLPEVWVEITAQIPARHTEADLTKLTFTADSWTEVRAALDLRKKDELMLGWFHSHPVREWCADCPIENQRVCKKSRDFFSPHDRALHRTIFPRAYSLALVVNDVGFSEPTFSLFGWRQGLIEPRGFYISERSEHAAHTAS